LSFLTLKISTFFKIQDGGFRDLEKSKS